MTAGAPGRAERCDADVVVIGGGAAGLASAIFAARAAPHLQVRCVDGARRVGAKILVSGGSRCNVTNRDVNEKDFWGGSSRTVRRVLRAFPADRAAAFFRELGVALHEEEDGKLFPDSNRARTVLDALLSETTRLGIGVDCGARVIAVVREELRFRIETASGVSYRAKRIVLATGGQSLPKTGSDGFGYELARRLGHGHVPTTPALAPLVLGEAGDGRHRVLAGVSHMAALTLASGGSRVRLAGPMLWTHFGASGPVALNMSRHWHRARLRGEPGAVSLSVVPGETFATLESWLLDQQAARPKARVQTVLASWLPASVAERWTHEADIESDRTMAHVTREDRRRLVQVLLEMPFDIRDSRGYTYAEVTAGGVPLEEIDPATMESRVCPGLHLAGEILDVDGRLGGFNFQWAWSSGHVAGIALGRALG